MWFLLIPCASFRFLQVRTQRPEQISTPPMRPAVPPLSQGLLASAARRVRRLGGGGRGGRTSRSARSIGHSARSSGLGSGRSSSGRSSGRSSHSSGSPDGAGGEYSAGQQMESWPPPMRDGVHDADGRGGAALPPAASCASCSGDVGPASDGDAGLASDGDVGLASDGSLRDERASRTSSSDEEVQHGAAAEGPPRRSDGRGDECGDERRAQRRQLAASWQRSRRRSTSMMWSTVGTTDYMAPEVLLETGYERECDWCGHGVEPALGRH